MGATGVAIAGLRRDDGGTARAVAHHGARVDRRSGRADRVERRLDLV
jgi:hypothetical protein